MIFNLAPKANANNYSGPSSMQALKTLYGQVRAHDVLLQCMYFVQIDDIFGIGKNIPWFKDKTLSYLVCEANMSFGSLESESFEAGAHPGAYLTKKSADEMDMTFIETVNGDIFKSYEACSKLAINDDGTVNEPKKYTFKITIGMINPKNPNGSPPITKSWLVAVKSGSIDLSASGRSEIIKAPITFQKIRPKLFER